VGLNDNFCDLLASWHILMAILFLAWLEKVNIFCAGERQLFISLLGQWYTIAWDQANMMSSQVRLNFCPALFLLAAAT
jgi:hypothetical protein